MSFVPAKNRSTLKIIEQSSSRNTTGDILGHHIDKLVEIKSFQHSMVGYINEK